ncbi:hypothetical protein MNBD_GAMMA08-1001 [hydrothermal vent metagenome]|uniref:DUF2726 domain-containing protein n=1 Tax=hydrothermal vent metagenome TaxID=652676 RepID=A0A3B0XZS7_9ZZZZ
MSNLKKILNLHEEATHLRLRDVCEKHGASIFSKVRLADILPIEGSGISDAEYKFALQSHFDFVVSNDTHTPLFAVEFDGPLHTNEKQQNRDKIKNKLCRKFDFPLLRINSNYLKKAYRGMDLLSWFVEVWFAWGWFEKAQASGEVPVDEIFMPQMMINIPGYDKQFPLMLSAPIRNKIQKLCFSEKIIDMVPSHIIGRSDDGTYRAISYIRVTKEQGIIVDTAMRSQDFPVSQVDALDELVTFQLYEKLIETLESGVGLIYLEEIASHIEEFKKKYEMRRAFSTSSSTTKGDPLCL